MNAPPPPLEITCDAVHRKRVSGEDFVLLDCREHIEIETANIDDSVWLPMSELMARVAELHVHRDRDIIVYCHLGARSLQVAAWLRDQGFPTAQSMAGGIDQWSTEIDTTLPRY